MARATTPPSLFGTDRRIAYEIWNVIVVECALVLVKVLLVWSCLGLLGFRVLLELIGIEPQSDCESYNMLYCEVRVEWVFICIFV